MKPSLVTPLLTGTAPLQAQRLFQVQWLVEVQQLLVVCGAAAAEDTMVIGDVSRGTQAAVDKVKIVK